VSAGESRRGGPREEIVEALRKLGAVPVYRLAKILGMSYGAVQWYVFTLEREGVVRTFRVGRKRYVTLNTDEWMDSVIVVDVLEELAMTLRALGVDPGMSLRDALALLERKAPHIAYLLHLLCRILEGRY
jgi:DNA-binding transcriptional ArsR family regulator